ncbi:MAG TPA: Asp-tRNA(Asn)/Glu-tRNA(Gln) amidotransferase subunit GatC [Bryobacteraceae bacterium]|nr:Asp-tRNA(Asn)/Glu-tRNA(Gln) amidotransferase subunit GatC [Bryobacteraceae bacterium]
MKITEQEVRYVADLANLRLDEQEVHRMAKDLDEILTHIDKLNELDTEGVEPMAQVLYQAEETATLREDVEHTPLGSDTALQNAAISGAGHFKIPRVIER